MARNIVVQVLGADKKVLASASTVADALTQLTEHAEYLASYPCWSYSVNGERASLETELADEDFVSTNQSVIGCGPTGCFCACGHRGRHRRVAYGKDK